LHGYVFHLFPSEINVSLSDFSEKNISYYIIQNKTNSFIQKTPQRGDSHYSLKIISINFNLLKNMQIRCSKKLHKRLYVICVLVLNLFMYNVQTELACALHLFICENYRTEFTAEKVDRGPSSIESYSDNVFSQRAAAFRRISRNLSDSLVAVNSYPSSIASHKHDTSQVKVVLRNIIKHYCSGFLDSKPLSECVQRKWFPKTYQIWAASRIRS